MKANVKRGRRFRTSVMITMCVSVFSAFSAFGWRLASSLAFADNPVDVAGSLRSSANPAEPIPHFPNRTAAFIWRNWNLIDLDAMAQTLDATPEQINEYALLMGLPAYEAPTWDSERAYITVLRRNWSLLPYGQILTLLRLSPNELAKKLREDDFLSVKLGEKPYCETLRYDPPTDSVRDFCASIARDAAPIFNSEPYRNAEPRFAFLDEFKDGDAPVVDSRTDMRDSAFEICYLHSYFAVFGDPLLQDSASLYPDRLLSALAERGVNGVWLHALLRDLAPPTELFPEFGEKSETRRDNLRDLVRRAKRFGIDVYLYMNEPRAMPNDFFDAYPNEKGVSEGDYSALCASSPKVRRWLSDALAGLFADVPELGGIFTISGSENLTTCVSHGRFADCPRCAAHTDVELISDLNAAMAEGVHRSAPDAKVIVWDWGWRGHGMAEDIIRALPKDVWLQSVSEWAVPFERGGVKSAVGEYSISVVGPGERAKTHWRVAKEVGLKTIAKCQFNTTWEMGSVPAIPALDLVARHASALSRERVDGVMAGWTLGGYPTANLEVANAFATDPNAEVDAVLDRFAERFFGVGASKAREGWKLVSDGFQEFPYAGAVVYNSPVHIGAANLLRLNPTGKRATMVGIPYDDLNSWRGAYPVDVFIDQMRKCGAGFLLGADALDEANRLAESNETDARSAHDKREAQRQARYARYAGRAYESVGRQARFIQIRDEIGVINASDRPDDAARDRLRSLREEMKTLVKEEIETTLETLALVCEDSRLGFESTNQYWYVPNDLVEKVVSCRHIERRLDELTRK